MLTTITSRFTGAVAMNKLLVGLLISLILLPPYAWAVPAFVQGQSATELSTDANVAVVMGNTTTGNLMACVIGNSNSVPRQLLSVTDSQSNTYVVSTKTTQSSVPVGVYIAYALNMTGGTTPTITATFTDVASSDGKDVTCGEFSGLTTGALDQQAGNAQDNPGTGTDAVTSGAVTTTVADELLIAGSCCTSGTIAAFVGTNYTLIDASPATGVTGTYRIVSATGSYAGTFTAGGATDDFGTRFATFGIPAAATILQSPSSAGPLIGSGVIQ